MNLMTTLRRGAALLLTVSALAVSNVTFAQPPGGMGGGMPPEMAAKMKAWQKWNDSHKNISNLGRALMQVRGVDKEPGTQLDKKQSASMLAIMKSWRTKPTMTDDQAKSVLKQMNGILNIKQIQKMQTIQGFGGGRGGGGGRPGGGGPGGGGGGRPGGGGGRPGGGFQMPDPPKGGYNPFNPDTLPFVQMRPRAKQSTDEFMANLAKRK